MSAVFPSFSAYIKNTASVSFNAEILNSGVAAGMLMMVSGVPVFVSKS